MKKNALNIVEDTLGNPCQGGWYECSRGKILGSVLHVRCSRCV